MFYPMLCKRKTYLFVPTTSISSIKTMDGESSSATQKSSRTNLGPSPKYFCISSLPTTHKNVANVEFASACSKFQPHVFTFRLHLMHWCQYQPKTTKSLNPEQSVLHSQSSPWQVVSFQSQVPRKG